MYTPYVFVATRVHASVRCSLLVKYCRASAKSCGKTSRRFRWSALKIVCPAARTVINSWARLLIQQQAARVRERVTQAVEWSQSVSARRGRRIYAWKLYRLYSCIQIKDSIFMHGSFLLRFPGRKCAHANRTLCRRGRSFESDRDRTSTGAIEKRSTLPRALCCK